MSLPANRLRGNRGVALVLVLWILTLLTIMTMGYSATMRTDTRLTAHAVQSAQARSVSQGGIWYGVGMLLDPNSGHGWRYDGTAYPMAGNDSLEIRIYDEGGKIDLNAARAELLLGLLESSGVVAEQAESLVQSIEDWRDRDNLTRLSGAENEEYFRAGFDYGAKNGPFNTVGELRQVLGMTEQLYQILAPALTVYSHRTSINPDAAPRSALLALPGINPDAVETYLQGRQTGELANNTIAEFGSRYIARAGGRIFTVASTGRMHDAVFTTWAIVMLKQNAQLPFSILSWSETGPLN